MSKRIYISGQISGLHPEVAKELFAMAQEVITTRGDIALNPLEIWPQEHGWQWEDYLADNVRFLLKCGVDGMYMLENWPQSKGARIEFNLAQELGISIEYQNKQQAAAMQEQI